MATEKQPEGPQQAHSLIEFLESIPPEINEDNFAAFLTSIQAETLTADQALEIDLEGKTYCFPAKKNGSYAQVYFGYTKSTPKQFVALKTDIDRATFEKPEVVKERLQRERDLFRSHSDKEDTYFPRLLAEGSMPARHNQDQTTKYGLLETIPGVPLSSMFKNQPELVAKEEFQAALALQILKLYEEMETSGYVLRDLGPNNIFITHPKHKNFIRIPDANDIYMPDKPRLSQPGGNLVGRMASQTPNYLRGEAPSISTELFLLGLMLYELGAEGKLPINQTGNSQYSLMSPAEIFITLKNPNSTIGRLTRRLLDEDPTRRPTIEEIKSKLTPIVENSPLKTFL